MSTHTDHLDEVRDNPYAWPGGYPKYAITDDGGCICAKCAKDEYERLACADPGDGFYITALDINWEDTELTCDHCSDRIESAYGDAIED